MTAEDIEKAVSSAVNTAKSKIKVGAGGSVKAQRKTAKRNFPFQVDKDGVYRKIESEQEDGTMRTYWRRFGSELHVLALTRNDEGEDWGRLLEVTDRDGMRHKWAMPSALLAGSGDPLRAELLRLGFELEPDRSARSSLLEYLIKAEPEKRARCVCRVGWHGKSYVLPGGAISADCDSEEVILQTSEKLDHAFNISGSLEDWREAIAARALGNSRLVLSLSAAFGAPLLALTGDEGGGFHFRGASSSGKSTALTVAASVWGGGGTRGFVRQWRATDNGLESIAGVSCDGLLCLDELSQLDAKAAGAAAYLLANGKGKARAGLNGQARKAQEWRILFLSNGEIGLADKIKEGGGRIAAGMEVRVIDLRADAGAGMGLFEDTHDEQDPAFFSRALKAAADNTYGTAGRAFVAELVNDLPKYRERITQLRKTFMDWLLPVGSDGQVYRVADRFALVAAAGELASDMGITGWPAWAAGEAVQRCFKDWLIERGGIGASEVAEAKRRIAETLELHGSSRFQRWAKSSSDRIVITNRVGFVKTEESVIDDEVESTYFFMPQPLKEVLTGLDFRAVITELVDAGVIVAQNGKPNKMYHVSSGGGKHRLYQIDRDKLDGGPESVTS
ncbi:membrane protein [Pseudovibrio japonicus]|uniref:Membrane protein n=1 Tax=Pseudovibrio japonicus TaxID=366534 RepID=A0ABQ3EMW4_9HYPH|nr:DUF927 domain-containing protein [Pseudovibrio japonicus]GHB47574.1 membrane protein [Pseudovibrio japonicus]